MSDEDPVDVPAPGPPPPAQEPYNQPVWNDDPPPLAQPPYFPPDDEP